MGMNPIKLVGGGPLDGEERLVGVNITLITTPRCSQATDDGYEHAYVRIGLDEFAYDGIRAIEVRR